MELYVTQSQTEPDHQKRHTPMGADYDDYDGDVNDLAIFFTAIIIQHVAVETATTINQLNGPE